MIAADRIVRLARNIVGDGMRGDYKRVDPIDDLPYPVELDLEDRATVLRLWSGEVDEITFFNGRARPRSFVPSPEDDPVEILRDVIVDALSGSRPLCDSVAECACSTARAWRYLRAAGRIEIHPADEATS